MAGIAPSGWVRVAGQMHGNDSDEPMDKSLSGLSSSNAEKGMELPSIVLLICYFGKLPFWMPAFLRTCEKNPTIDWLIFTDSKPPSSPSNVRFLDMDLAAFNEIAARRTGFAIEISAEYLHKICDLKGVYGKIFEDWISGYDFWGHCDIDILWGDMRKFMTNRMLDRYDILTGRKNKIGGHFTIYKNDERWRNLYKKIPGIEQLLTSNEHHAVDEGHMAGLLSKLQGSRLSRLLSAVGLRSDDTVPRVFWNARLTVNGGRQLEARRDEGRYLHWKNGKVYDVNGQELMYLHFHRLKDSMEADVFVMDDGTVELFVDDTGIHTRPPPPIVNLKHR